eukprot:190732-Chlamydomonas_euryale.AAC.10
MLPPGKSQCIHGRGTRPSEVLLSGASFNMPQASKCQHESAPVLYHFLEMDSHTILLRQRQEPLPLLWAQLSAQTTLPGSCAALFVLPLARAIA